jgi:hypothetical protein
MGEAAAWEDPGARNEANHFSRASGKKLLCLPSGRASSERPKCRVEEAPGAELG